MTERESRGAIQYTPENLPELWTYVCKTTDLYLIFFRYFEFFNVTFLRVFRDSWEHFCEDFLGLYVLNRAPESERDRSGSADRRLPRTK